MVANGGMNASCPSWFRQEVVDDARNVAIVVVLGVINAVVIGGNLLVVLAVSASAKLRTVTNLIIVSLAVSDLLVGLAVLPYSIALEVLEVWVFGELWCQMWLAMDVWLCTASILNLCAISVDRYLAITRPVHYRTIMSKLRVQLLIAGVWVLSFVICFPPLVGWNDRVRDDQDLAPLGNLTHLNATEEEELRLLVPRCPKPQCALITNQGYVVYSALGSFYLPMLVMLFFYYRIYVVALRTSRALDRGFRTPKSNPDVTLRIHRGRPSNEPARAGDILVPRRIPTVVYHRAKEHATRAAHSRVRRTQSANASLEEDPSPPRNGRHVFSRLSKRNARLHARRFRSEAKATKTVGVIVGGFIVCWLPFFTVYLTMGFCGHCVPELLFKVFFYLGYCNSALNPIIYAMMSRDFRAAFHKILCRCRLKDDGVTSLIRQLHMPTFFEEEQLAAQPQLVNSSPG